MEELIAIARDLTDYGTPHDENKWRTKIALYSYLKTDTLMRDTVPALDSVWVIIDSVVKGKLCYVNKHLSNGQITTAQSINNSISPCCQIEWNLQEVYDIQLALSAQEIADFDSATIQVLVAIAEQCPWYGGEGVFEARGILDGLNIPYLITDECIESGKTSEPASGQGGDNARIVEYPNPTGSEMVFRIEGPFTGDVEVRIFNLHGVEVGNVSLTQNQTQNRFNVTNITSGIYLWKADVDGKEFTGKVTVIK